MCSIQRASLAHSVLSEHTLVQWGDYSRLVPRMSSGSILYQKIIIKLVRRREVRM